MPGQEWLDWLGERGRRGGIYQRIMAGEEEGRLMGGPPSPSPPLPQLAQDGQGRRLELVAAFDTPDGVQVGRALPRRVLDEPRAGFLLPDQPPAGLQFWLEAVRERLEVMCVVTGITFHPFGQRAQCPVGFLRPLLQLRSEERRVG